MRAHYHIRCICSFRKNDTFPTLQYSPVFLFQSKCQSLVQLEFAFSVYNNIVSITYNIMIYSKGFYFKTIKFKALLTFCYFHILYFKRQFRCHNPQRIYYSRKSFGSYHNKRCCLFCISHRQKHTRQSRYMVSMIMGKTHYINRFWTPALFFHGYLSTLTTIY